MKFHTSRDKALESLDNFINNDIIDYSSKRNYDFGPIGRKNVSCLSPYISHRLINEYEISKKVLSKHPYQKVEKYIQEIYWRVYWKGWLELRPKVWDDFTEDLNIIEESENYFLAINGQTKIECFNDWVKEIKEYNYLHNHARMWFASIWIFTLGLPWQKGAEFFMKYLLDGDAASNTLSWRWVGGLQTKGKHYLAQSWNIGKFLNKKYQNIELKENALPLIDNREYKISPTEIQKKNSKNKYLIVFENDLSMESSKIKDYKKIYFVLLDNKSRLLKLDSNVLNYKKNIIKDQTNKIDDSFVLTNENEIKELLESLKNFDIVYPSIGENMSFLKKIFKEKKLNLNFITRDEDIFCWNFSNKGYFNFKSNIPKILAKFQLN
ncbi:MAG: Deoxyribodipyrimidine photolyase [Pelagibacterales bacterium]|nr:Deoxyribodipyrimidine photolyase [Pelagibacterales bacterium]